MIDVKCDLCGGTGWMAAVDGYHRRCPRCYRDETGKREPDETLTDILTLSAILASSDSESCLSSSDSSDYSGDGGDSSGGGSSGSFDD